jgi:dephospho-CoA kinase
VAARDAAEPIPFVGLTGAIGAGKSEALSALERLGAATLSTDAVVHELQGSDEVRDLLIERLGPEVAPDGAVDRGAVARLVFEHPEQREWLEGMLWPRVGQRIADWREGLEGLDPRPLAAVVEVPLLFESGFDQVFDHTLVITADDELRAERAGARGHEGLAERETRQLTQEQKTQRADSVIRNDGDLPELQEKLSMFLETMNT